MFLALNFKNNLLAWMSFFKMHFAYLYCFGYIEIFAFPRCQFFSQLTAILQNIAATMRKESSMVVLFPLFIIWYHPLYCRTREGETVKYCFHKRISTIRYTTHFEYCFHLPPFILIISRWCYPVWRTYI